MPQNDDNEYPRKITQGLIGAPPLIIYGSGVVVKAASLILTNTTTLVRTVEVLHGDGVTLYFTAVVPDGGTALAPEQSVVRLHGIEFVDGLALGGVVVDFIDFTLAEPVI